MADVVKKFETTDKWYECLKDIYSTLSSYKIQKNTTLYFDDFEDWENDPNSFDYLKIFDHNYQKFLEKLYPNDQDKKETCKFIKLKTSQLRDLNEVIELTLQSKVEHYVISNILFVEGHIVKFSDSINENGNLKNYDQVRIVIIYALNKIFIDEDVNNLREDLQVLIISPQWHVIDQRQINLRGENRITATNDLDEDSDEYERKKWIIGSNFYGIGDVLIGIENLTIIADEHEVIILKSGKEVEVNIDFDGFEDTDGNFLSIDIFLREYRLYLGKNLQHKILKESLLAFLDKLNSKIGITEVYNTLEPIRNYSNPESTTENASESPNPTEFWEELIEDVYSLLSDYSIQKDRHGFITEKIYDWKVENAGIEQSNFETFLQDIYAEDSEKYLIFDQIQPTTSNLEELNEVIEISLQLPKQDGSDTLFVEGVNVKFSDFIDKEGKFHAQSEPKKIVIFALRKVFIDTKIDGKGKELEVIIIAPQWEVVGEVEINLDGAKGQDRPLRDKIEGESGKAGLPGGPGGYFFGIADKVMNGEYLTISGGGGLGGQGEPGANGKDGEDELYAAPTSQELPCISRSVCAGDPNIRVTSSDGRPHEFKCRPSPDMVPWDVLAHWKDGGYGIECSIYMKGDNNGKIGGDGGNGGVGGLGGSPGNIEIISFTNNHRINIKERKQGDRGLNGKGSEGGKGGKTGGDYKYIKWSHLGSTWTKLDEWKTEPKKLSDGKSGKDGASKLDLKEPDPAKGVSEPLYFQINDYKSFMREYLKYPSMRVLLMAFLKDLSERDELNREYDVFGFLQEFKRLENDLIVQRVKSGQIVEFYAEHELKDQIDFLPFYTFLLQRVYTYVNQNRRDSKFRDIVKILKYVKVSILSRIYNLTNNQNRNVVYRVIDFLKNVEKRFEALEEDSSSFKKTFQAISTIDNLRNETIAHFNDRVKEATSFAETMVPELDIIERSLKKLEKDLLTEVHNAQIKQHNRTIELKIEEEKLKFAVALKVITGIMKIGGTIATVFGPVGVAVGGIIVGTATVIDTMIPAQEEGLLKDAISKVPEKMDILENFVKEKKTEETKKLRQALVKFTEDANGNKHLKDVMVEAKIAIAHLDNPDSSFVAAQLEVRFKEKLNIAEETIKIEKKIDDKYEKTENIIGRTKAALSVGAHAADLYFSLQQYANLSDQTKKSITKAEQEFKRLEEFESRIHTDMDKALDDTVKHLKEVKEESEGKSRTGLYVQKFQVQKFLQGFKDGMEIFTKGFEVHVAVQHGIEKYREIMNTLIGLYDFMEQYQEDKRLIGFISDIAGTIVGKSYYKDEKLAKEVRGLEIAIFSNLLLKYYQLAIDSFKQYAFPFTSHYFSNVKIPPNFVVENYADTIVRDAGKRIKDLVSKLTDSSPFADRYQHCIREGPFNREVVDVGPFFHWSHDEYNNTIADLLSGKKVQLYTNVKKSPVEFDAIKFNEVSFEFVAINRDSQYELDNALTHFRLVMEHTGDSYYRYNNEIYRITTDRNRLDCHRQKINGTFTHCGLTNREIRNGNFILSPYTLWNLELRTVKGQLNSYNPEKLVYSANSQEVADYILGFGKTIEQPSVENEEDTKPFEILKPFFNKVELYLEGNARYVRLESDCVDPSVHQYYEPLEDITTTKTSSKTISENPPGHKSFVGPTRSKREIQYLESIMNETDKLGHDEVDEYTTSSASLSISSPINGMFNWIKKHTILLAPSTFSSLQISYKTFRNLVFDHENEFHDAMDEDVYYDASATFNAELEPEVEFNFVLSGENNPNVRDYKNSEYLHQLQVCDTNNYGPNIVSLPGESLNKEVSTNFEGSGLLMLADLLCRSYTGEKYKQAATMCPMQLNALKIQELKEQVYGAISHVN